MATVYLARDVKHGRDVALKALHPDLAATLGRERFLREIQMAARLVAPAHPPAVRFRRGRGSPLLRDAGGATASRCATDSTRESRLPVSDAVRIARDVAQRSRTRTSKGSCTATSSRRTSCCRTATRSSRTSASARRSARWARTRLTQAGMARRDARVHEPRAGGGRSRRRTQRPVLARLRALRDARRRAAVHRPNVQAIIAKRFVQTPADVTALRDGVPRNVARAVQQALARTPIDRFPTSAAFADALLAAERRRAAPSAGDPPRALDRRAPFVNLSPDRDNEFLGDGIAEDIINALASSTDCTSRRAPRRSPSRARTPTARDRRAAARRDGARGKHSARRHADPNHGAAHGGCRRISAVVRALRSRAGGRLRGAR